ncbi:hypothetical protein CLF_104613 [Clonorchis sinensis]|uniref:Uncharacterized protein n=1 Tax=Clonorchis sinensis TaxID=79923 RepID=G7YNW7_CLOSI|nr:hypothetical protein CLF_104613 [Clonorchis sinensis]
MAFLEAFQDAARDTFWYLIITVNRGTQRRTNDRNRNLLVNRPTDSKLIASEGLPLTPECATVFSSLGVFSALLIGSNEQLGFRSVFDLKSDGPERGWKLGDRFQFVIGDHLCTFSTFISLVSMAETLVDELTWRSLRERTELSSIDAMKLKTFIVLKLPVRLRILQVGHITFIIRALRDMQNDRNAHPVKKEQPFQAFKMANARSYFRNMCHMNGRCTWSRQKKHSKDASTIRQRFDKSLFSTAWTSAGLGCESMSLLREHAGVYGHITRYTEKNIDRTCNRAMTANNRRGEIQGQPLADRQAIILPIWQIFKIVVSANKFGLMSDIVHPASNLERFTIRHSDDFCFGVIGETFTCYECQNCPLPIKEGTKVSEKNCQACQVLVMRRTQMMKTMMVMFMNCSGRRSTGLKRLHIPSSYTQTSCHIDRCVMVLRIQQSRTIMINAVIRMMPTNIIRFNIVSVTETSKSIVVTISTIVSRKLTEALLAMFQSQNKIDDSPVEDLQSKVGQIIKQFAAMKTKSRRRLDNRSTNRINRPNRQSQRRTIPDSSAQLIKRGKIVSGKPPVSPLPHPKGASILLNHTRRTEPQIEQPRHTLTSLTHYITSTGRFTWAMYINFTSTPQSGTCRTRVCTTCPFSDSINDEVPPNILFTRDSWKFRTCYWLSNINRFAPSGRNVRLERTLV